MIQILYTLISGRVSRGSSYCCTSAYMAFIINLLLAEDKHMFNCCHLSAMPLNLVTLLSVKLCWCVGSFCVYCMLMSAPIWNRVVNLNYTMDNIIESHYFILPTQSNVYSFVKLNLTNGSNKILVASLKRKIFAFEYSDNPEGFLKPYLRELSFTYIPSNYVHMCLLYIAIIVYMIYIAIHFLKI